MEWLWVFNLLVAVLMFIAVIQNVERQEWGWVWFYTTFFVLNTYFAATGLASL